MKAVRIHEFGGSDKMQVEDVPVPEIGAHDALVRIRAAAVNPVDWMARERIYNPEGQDRVPLTLGQDFSGIIEKVPEKVPEKVSADGAGDFRVGDEVIGEVFGSFAEFAAVPLKDLVRKPAEIDFVIAASIPMPGLTAWQLIAKTARAAPGMSILIHGASGGVGSFAVQFAKLKGAHVIATASPSSFQYLRGIGVDELIDYRSQRFEDRVKDVDVVIDPLGGDVQLRSWRVLKKGGTLINLIGEIDETAAKKAGAKGVEFGMEYDIGDLEQIVRLVAEGKVKPHIAKVLRLEEARQALDLNQRGESHGKLILAVA